MEGATVTITAATRWHLCAAYRLPVIRVALRALTTYQALCCVLFFFFLIYYLI